MQDNKNINKRFSFGSFDSWKQTIKNIKSDFGGETIFKTTGFVVAITALFLQINIDNDFLKRSQLFFLLLLISMIFGVFIRVMHILLKGGDSRLYNELYISVLFIPLCLGLALIYCLFKFILDVYLSELIFYLKWLFIPITFLISSLSLIFLIKMIRKCNFIEGSSLENYFIISIGLVITLRFSTNHYDISNTLISFLNLKFDNILLLYYLLIALLSEFIFSKKYKKRSELVLPVIFIILLAVSPFVFRYLPYLLIK